MKSIFILKKETKPQGPQRMRHSSLFNKTWLVMLLLSLSMWQCKKDGYVETKGVCPEVILSVPANNGINVVANKPITATFNEPMNASTITTATFLLTQGNNSITGMKQAAAPVSGTVTPQLPSSSGQTATFTFTPTSPLAPFTLYTGTMKKGVKDPLNNALQEDYVWSFTTQPLATLSSNPVIGGVISGGGLYDVGTTVTASIVPNAGFVFANWTEAGVVVSTNVNFPFAIAGNRTLVANFTGATAQFTVAMSSNPLLGGTTTGAGSFNSGASVTVSAVNNLGFTFTNWTEGANIVSTNANYTFNLDANKTFIANFTPVTAKFTVALSSIPLLGGTTTGGGSFNSGAAVTVRAVNNLGFTFTNWTEGASIVSTNANYTFNINANKTFIANFTPVTAKFTVALSSIPLLGGTTTGGGSFNSGASVTIGAVANLGFTFTNWTEGANIVSTNASYTFNLNANKTYIANFAPIAAQFTVGLSSNPLLGGTTNGGGSFNSGASVTIGAVSNLGFTFTNWTEGANIVSTMANYTFNINANKTFVANFTANVIPGGPLGINLRSAGNFAVLGGSGVSNTGVTTRILGDVGAFPTSTINGLLAGNVNGNLYLTADPIVGQAKIDLTTAYNDAQSRSLNAISLPGQLGGLTLAPGLYVNSSTSGISGTGANGILTLDAGGNANAVWIFKTGSTFVTDAGTSIVLAGGAQAKNIFWSIGSSATLGTNSIFYGTILADQAITLTTGATLYGRALTRIAAVTLDSNTVTKP